MLGIILTGHGGFASGLEQAMKQILGEQPQFIAIDFPETSSTARLTAQLEQAAERGSRQALAQRTHHAACDEDVFHFKSVLLRMKNGRNIEQSQIHSQRSVFYPWLKIFSTRATSSGTSTPTLS